MSRHSWEAALVALSLLGLAACGSVDSVAGNSASTGNFQAAGIVVRASGAPVSGAYVECRPDSFTAWEALPSSWRARTDSLGRYRCTELPASRVGVTVYDPGTGRGHWHQFDPSRDTGTVRDTVVAAGSLTVAFSPKIYGTAYLLGTSVSMPLDSSVVTFSHVPAGWRGAVRYKMGKLSPRFVDSAAVISGTHDSANFTRDSVTLRISLAGGLAAALTDVPLLVHLDSTWSGFATALADGSDLRLSRGGRSLPLTLRFWDKSCQKAVLWTRLDTLAAPGDSVDITLSWGLPVPSETSASVFTSAAGWLAAWPLGDTGSVMTDYLGAFPGTGINTSTVSSPVGPVTHFNGRAEVYIAGSDTTALALPQGGPYTLSCWVKMSSDTVTQYLAGNSLQGTQLLFAESTPADSTASKVWFGADYSASPVGPRYSLSPATAASWTQLTLTVTDTVVTLYVNGTAAVKTGFSGYGLARRKLPFLIGAAIDTGGLTTTYSHFSGDIGDVWVQSKVRPADWVRITAKNQASLAAAEVIVR